MKGIILAAGSGTRLYPATLSVSKILLPIYDRPMVYYPLSILMSASIKDILIITNERDSKSFKKTLGDGSQFGIHIDYDIQRVQRGLSDAFIIAEEWIGSDEVVLILGDNIFYGDSLESSLEKAKRSKTAATIFGYRVPDPRRFGVVEFDDDMNVLSIEEKPNEPKSDYASIGLYFYKRDVSSIAKTLEPSERGELEVTDLNIRYLEKNDLSIILLDDDVKWIDAGTFESMLGASIFVKDEERRLGKKIMCPEIIAFDKGFITKSEITKWIKDNNFKSDYYRSILEELKTR